MASILSNNMPRLVKAKWLTSALIAMIVAAGSAWEPVAAEPAQVVAQAGTKPKPRPAEGAGGGGGGGSDAGLQRRVEQLEEQLVDMQVTIGTLETLARSGGGGGSSASSGGGGLSGGDAAKLEGMETQIRALSSEVQRLTSQVRQLGGGGNRGDAGGNYDGGRPAAYAEAERPARPSGNASASSSFGSTTVTQGRDPIGSMIDSEPLPPPQANGRETTVAALPPAASNSSAKQEYETAYGHLLRQDYGAAEAAFDQFLKTYPSDQLAGNAQYWLGETHFVRGNYKAAAGAFLKGYQNFAKSNKAPDSLLKLAMSLDKLGQKDAACSSFGELVTRFPESPEHIKSKAAAEQKRLACR